MTDIIQRIAMKAVILNDEGKVLLVRVADTPKAGPNAGKYGLPGGKLKPGEAWNEGLVREVFEETGIKVTPTKPISIGEWRPEVQGLQLQIVGVFITCTAERYEVTLSSENDAYLWASKQDFSDVEVMEPDRQTALDSLT